MYQLKITYSDQINTVYGEYQTLLALAKILKIYNQAERLKIYGFDAPLWFWENPTAEGEL